MITRHSINNFYWINLISPTPEEIKSISDEFNLDRTISLDIASPTPRQRFYESGKFIFAIFHIPDFRHTKSDVAQEIDFILGRNLAITTCYGNIEVLDKFRREAEVQEVLGKGNFKERHIFFHIMQSLQISLFDELAYMEDRISSIENKIFAGEEKDMVFAISEASRDILNFRKTIEPHREVLESLKDSGEERFGPAFKESLYILLQNWRRINEIAHSHSDMIAELRDTNNSLLSTKQNEIMKTLTVLAAITIPASIIAAIFNMQVDLPIENSPNGFIIIIGIMALASAIMFVYFRLKKWI